MGRDRIVKNNDATTSHTRAFVRLREAMASSKELARRLDELEKRIASQDESIRTLFQAVRQLMAAPEKPPKKIGIHVREKRASYGSKYIFSGLRTQHNFLGEALLEAKSRS